MAVRLTIFTEICREDAGNETASFQSKAMVAGNKNKKV